MVDSLFLGSPLSQARDAFFAIGLQFNDRSNDNKNENRITGYFAHFIPDLETDSFNT